MSESGRKRKRSFRVALLTTTLLVGMTIATVASAYGRSTAPGARVSIVGVYGNGGQVFHVGGTLQYSALVYESATRKELAAQSVSFALVTSSGAVSLRSRPYKPYFWTGTIEIPHGLTGPARVRATIDAGGRHFSVVSLTFTIRGPVTAVRVGRASSQGDYAVAIATGTIKRPADGYVLASVEMSPSQSVDMNWSVVCVRGTSASSSSGSATDGGPGTVSGGFIIKKVKMPLPNADSCTVSFSAQLENSGSLKIDMLGNSLR